MRWWIVLFLALVFGCGQEQAAVKPKNWQTQTCELCGHVWEVYAPSGEKIPPTVKWCFNDGNVCEAGFDLLLDTLEKDEPIKKSAEMTEHCKTCVGCRCAWFSPEEWALAAINQE